MVYYKFCYKYSQQSYTGNQTCHAYIML